MSTDQERFEESLDIATAGRGAGTLRQLAYPVYVTFLVGLTYGFAFTRFVFIASDPAWVSTHLLTPAAAGVCALLVAMAAGFVARTSRQRGAVVPPAAWTDQVLLSSIDRAVAVRPWWHLTLGAASTVGGLLGTLLGSSLWASTVTGPLALPLAALVGALIGALLAYVALCGQAGSPRPVTPASALRLLRIEDLRAQAATGDHLVGALLAGDVRAAQLEVAPVTRGAAGALRAGRPAATLVRRDVLGLRRDRFTLARAVLLTLLGCAAIAWAVLEVGAPPILAALGLVFAHFGAGAAAEGLRMSADHSGSPTLYGLSPARSALAHSVVPGALTASVWIVGAAAVLLAVGADFRSGAMTLAADRGAGHADDRRDDLAGDLPAAGPRRRPHAGIGAVDARAADAHPRGRGLSRGHPGAGSRTRRRCERPAAAGRGLRGRRRLGGAAPAKRVGAQRGLID